MELAYMYIIGWLSAMLILGAGFVYRKYIFAILGLAVMVGVAMFSYKSPVVSTVVHNPHLTYLKNEVISVGIDNNGSVVEAKLNQNNVPVLNTSWYFHNHNLPMNNTAPMAHNNQIIQTHHRVVVNSPKTSRTFQLNGYELKMTEVHETAKPLNICVEKPGNDGSEVLFNNCQNVKKYKVAPNTSWFGKPSTTADGINTFAGANNSFIWKNTNGSVCAILTKEGNGNMQIVKNGEKTMVNLTLSEQKTHEISMVICPQQRQILRDYNIHGVMSFGWLSFIPLGLTYILDHLNSMFNNSFYGFLLFILVFFILNIPFLYEELRRRARMKLMNERMQLLQQQYALDPMGLMSASAALQYEFFSKWSIVGMIGQLIVFYYTTSYVLPMCYAFKTGHFLWIQDISAAEGFSIVNLYGLMPWGSFLNIGIITIIGSVIMYFCLLIPNEKQLQKTFGPKAVVFIIVFYVVMIGRSSVAFNLFVGINMLVRHLIVGMPAPEATQKYSDGIERIN